jgi:murein DD-endopeptidase MepM/ murein hydrolase activator NlpD
LRHRSIVERLEQHFERLGNLAQRLGALIAKKAAPYVKARYWAVYGLAFAAGLYLFGPTHGWQKLHRANMARHMAKEAPQSMVALQQELRILKKDLQQLTVTPPDPAQFTPDQFSRPAAGKIVNGYQWFVKQHIWRLHPGVDFQAPLGSAVLAVAPGRVVGCERSAHGFMIKLSHGNAWESVYIDLTAARVRIGQAVLQGQTIGVSGLIYCIKPEQAGFHFGLYHERKPVDPRKFISGL